MPLTAINYANTIIYRIFSDNCDYVYVGSTTDFTRRKASHKSNCNNETTCSYNLKVYQTIRENGGWDAFKMLEVEEYPCENSKQAQKREQYWIDFYKSNLNSKKAFAGETLKESKAQYYIENYEKYKQYRIEYAEENKAYAKNYYQENKEEQKQTAKQHRIEHAEQIKQQKAEYYQQHKEELTQKITCECGAIVAKSSLTRHKKLKHLEAV
jgi:hypothetical protein